ncbi:hypothetical protein AZI86_14595 [Bdellovibrio bacteriovorus]|uniref:Uncharacterized protein n=1 Tax=Bdellovibrio bacteriovorus TaxID=959 RepID=A0A150WK81_BDEBC|nr:hypothetical protein [Bdellovibrio bacteriovorus]KYG64033.1 hypothetical protein AZI86_14595 [Bdellovibrio bacteriovorus]
MGLVMSIITVMLVFCSSVFAQSIGGGLGGDRPKTMRSLTIRPMVIQPAAMGCNEVQDFIIKHDKARVNFRYKKVPGYQVIFSRYAIACGNVRMQTPIAVRTKDRESCYVGFVCGGG